MAKLVIRTGTNEGAEYPLKDAHVSLGRRSQSDIPVADAKSSREHALIIDQSGTLFLQDLSRNGTFINDQPALKTEPGTELKFGDKIKIGDTVYELIDEKSEPIDIDIPGYTILEVVGTGGMGIVYQARQLSMDRVVALKVLNERYSNNAEFVDRFIREARAAGKLNHPNVIHVHDISRANGRHYFSMEFIDGPSVRELLKSEKLIEVNKALDIIMQAAKALEFAHENRIVHRDIKPDNLMLTKEGIVKIADLGIAKTFEESSAGAKDQRGVLGTPHYMAPEQALGKAIDHRADIYSLGATFYHMLTGHTPFTGSSAQEILKAHVQSSLPPIQDLCETVPDPVCFIIERMMAKLPEKRYQDMSKLIEDIERVQSGHVKGIERIDASDSSVMRAVKGTPAPKPAPPRNPTSAATTVRTRRRRASFTELATGAHSPVGRVAAAVFWVALFLAAIWAVIALPKYLSRGPSNEDKGKNEKAKVSKPEAHTLLTLAKIARDNKDYDEADRKLFEIRTRFPETLEYEEASAMVIELSSLKYEADKQKAEKLLAEAKKFETDNPQNAKAILDKWKEVVNGSGGHAAVNKEARAKVEQLEQGSPSIQAKQRFSMPAKEVFDKADAARAAFDYDSARKLLKELRDSSQNLDDGAEARSRLKAVDEEALAKVKEYKDKTATMDPVGTALEWAKYSASVKDEVNSKDVQAILAGLEDKTEEAGKLELSKAADKAKTNQYADAIEAVQLMQKRWAGLKWSILARAKEASFKRQKELYDTFFKLVAEKVPSGPIKVDAPIKTKYNNDKWAITGVREDSIALDPIAKAAGPGISVKLTDLAPKDQYQLILAALPKTLTKEQHLQLKSFCEERGLTDEAEKHEKLAN